MKRIARFNHSNPVIRIPTLIATAAFTLGASRAAEIIPLGDAPGGDIYSSVYDLSADGRTVLGVSSTDAGFQFFRWTLESGFQAVPSFNATAISGNGDVVVGSVETDRLEAAKWSEVDGLVPLGTLATFPGFAEFSAAYDVSGDGLAIVGVGSTLNTPFSEALLWNPTSGVVPLGFLPDDQPEEGAFSLSFAYAVSADGQVVVGASASTKHVDRAEQAFRWTSAGGMQPLGILPGAFQSVGTAVSADGSIVAGVSGSEAFRWAESTGLQSLGQFIPNGISADGNLVVGRAFLANGAVAIVWTPETGAVPLQSWLEQSQNLVIEGWQAFVDAAAVSDDGLIIAGNGVNAAGENEGFLVTLEAEAPVTSASASISGAARLYIVDSAGRRFGIDPATGETHTEIPEMSMTEEGGLTTYSWPELADGTYQYQVFGLAGGTYELQLSFAHADGQFSGQTLSARLGAGGLHIYAASIDAEAAAGTQITRTYADSDGDRVIDSADAVLFSDMRPTVFVGAFNTGIPNKVLSNGATINDIIARLLNGSTTRSEFVTQMSRATAELSAKGAITAADKKKLTAAMAHFDLARWSAAKAK